MRLRLQAALASPVTWIVLLAGTIAAVQAWNAAGDPIFEVNAGYRTFFADRPVVKLFNRIWLPFLQVQIWLYYLTGLPVEGLKLITVPYSALGLGCLGLYWGRVLGSGIGGSVLALAAMLAFPRFAAASGADELMQEPVGFGLLFLFSYLAVRHGQLPWIALGVGASAMLTRDTFWVYLFAVTVAALAVRPWSLRWRRFLAGLWAIPVLWLAVCLPALYLIAYRRLPAFPTEWPLGRNPATIPPSFGATLASLQKALTASHVVYLAAALGLAAVALILWRRPQHWVFGAQERFARLVLFAAPLALLIVYGALVATDPWQATPGHRRQAWPLLEVCFLVAPLLIRASVGAPGVLRGAVAVCVAGGLLACLGANPASPPRPLSNATLRSELAKLQTLLDTAGEGKGVTVCIETKRGFVAYTDLSRPTYRHRQIIVAAGEPIPEACRVLVIEDGMPLTAPEPFVERLKFTTGLHRFSVYAQ